MIQPANLNLFELLNYVVANQPSALGILVLNERVDKVEFLKRYPTKGKVQRVAKVTFELPERVGENLRGPEPDQALLVAFSIDRATYDEYLRRVRLAESGIVLPPGATI